jgi:hypothetical protein
MTSLLNLSQRAAASAPVRKALRCLIECALRGVTASLTAPTQRSEK